MRALGTYQDGTVMQTYVHATQYSSLADRAGEAAWNEWEIQCLVLASFSLQVFLLLSAPFRKRHRSRVLNALLWVAYLMADYVATYLLGRLTLLVAVAADDGGRQELALFWAPFLLLHLGGQETITAFSMEDNTLWKRRLLDLAAQVAMAVYVVGKQWRGGRLLVAPMVLMFVCGAVKYGEGIWALRAAAVRAPGSSSVAYLAHRRAYQHERSRYKRFEPTLFSIFNSGDKSTVVERILEKAFMNFPASLDFFMDTTPFHVRIWARVYYDELHDALMELKSSENRDEMAYKLAEVHVSLIHDYLYTKFGTVRFQHPTSMWWAALQWLGSLGLTSVALVLFARANGSNRYSRPNVAISYILLVGAIVIEVSSIFIALVSSYWPGTCVAKHLHLHLPDRDHREWSRKMAQYNMVDASVQEKETRQSEAASGVVGATISRMLAKLKTTPEVVVSSEVMKLLLDQVLEIMTQPSYHNWDSSRFRGQWAQWVANRVDGGGDPVVVDDNDNDHAGQGPANTALAMSNIRREIFVPSVALWHLVTSICLLASDGPGELTNPCKELSNYIMYLMAKRGAMVDSAGHMEIARSLREVDGRRTLDDFGRAATYAPQRAYEVCVELLKIPQARDRWVLIAVVWTEILCYMALNCGAAFHAKHLATGGEFLTQVKMLLFILRWPMTTL